MDGSPAAQEFWLGDWHVQPSLGRLSDGQSEVHLEPRVMQVLELLASADGQLVTRDELFDGVWPNQVISDQALSSLVSRLRRQLGEDPRQPKLIGTVPKKGYRVLQPVRWTAPAQSPATTAVTPVEPRHRRASDATTDPATATSWGWLAPWFGLLILGAVALGFYGWSQRSGKPVQPGVVGVAALALPAASVAVLPFDNMSPSPDDAYFSDGISEELLNQLAGVPGLKVASRTSSFRYRGDEHDIRAIGANLNVEHVLEGSVRRDGPQLRVTVQLIDAASGYHRWSQTYDAQWRDILTVQRAITQAVVTQIKPQLLAGAEPSADGVVTDAGAYELYLLGRHHAHQRTGASLARSIELFEEAIAVQPDFALAYTGLAESYLTSIQYADFDPQQAQTKAEAALEQAVGLAPDQAETKLALGNLYRTRTQWPEAERELRAALELNPNLALAHMALGNTYVDTGRLVQAYAQYREALALSPLHATILLNLAESSLKLGLTERAEDYLARAEGAFPEHTFLFGFRTVIYQSEGNRAALTELLDEWLGRQAELSPGPTQNSRNQYLSCGTANAFLGRLEQARACLVPLVAQTADGGLTPKYRMMSLSYLALLENAAGNPRAATELANQAVALGQAARVEFPGDETLVFELAAANAVVGEHEQALALLDESIEMGNRHLGFMRHDPRLQSLHELPAWSRSIGALTEQQASMRARVLEQFPASGVSQVDQIRVDQAMHVLHKTSGDQGD